MLLLLEMQTHNHSIRLSDIFRTFEIYWHTDKAYAVMWHLLAEVTNHQAISLLLSLAGY